MKKIRLRVVFVYLLAALSGALLLHTSQSVQQAEEKLNKVARSVAQEQDSIRVLKTEWAYLNNPARLEILAKQYLGLGPAEPEKIQTGSPALPVQADPELEPASFSAEGSTGQ